MSDKKVPSMGIKKRMSFDGHTLHTHNEYPQSLRQHYLHQVRGYNLSLSLMVREGTPLLLRCKGKRKDWDNENFFAF